MFHQYVELYKNTPLYGTLLRADMFTRNHLSPILRSSYGTAYDHSVRVANIAIYDFCLTDPNLVLIALLHDILEDTNTSSEELAELFSFELVDKIRELSRNKNTLPGHIQIEKPIRRIIQNLLLHDKSTETKIIKCSDRIDNLRDMLQIPQDDEKYERIPSWVAETKLSLLPLSKSLPSKVHNLLKDELSKVEEQFQSECDRLFDTYVTRLEETFNTIDTTAVNISTASIIFADSIS